MNDVTVQMYIPKYPMEAYLNLRDAIIKALPGITEAPMCAGAWRSGKGELMQEGVVIITAVVPEREVSTIDALLMQYKQNARQELVFYTITPTKVVTL